MRLQRLDLRFAPGLPDGLRVDGLDAGLWIVLGPNASGKSTLARAAFASLWPAEAPDGLSAVVTWRAGDTTRRARIDAGRVSWEAAPPPLPSADAAPLYRLDLNNLLNAQSSDGALSQQLATEMAGGYDIEAAKSAFSRTMSAGRAQREAVEKANRALTDALRDANKLAEEARELAHLRTDRDDARAARDAAQLAATAVAHAEGRARRASLIEPLAALPEGLERLHATDLGRLDELESDLQGSVESLAAARRALAGLRDELTACALAKVPAPKELAGLDARVGALAEAEKMARDAHVQAAHATARRAQAEADLFLPPNAPDRPAPSATQLDALDRALMAVEQAKVEAQAGEAHARWLAEQRPPAPPLELATLHRQLTHLEAWLDAPPVAPPAPVPVVIWRGPSPVVWWIVGLIATFAGLIALALVALAPTLAVQVAAAFVGGLLLWVGGASLGAAVMRANGLRGAPVTLALAADPRVVHAEAAEAAGVRLAGWTTEAVRGLADELRVQQGQHRLRDALEARLNAAREEVGRVQGARGDAERDLGAVLATLALNMDFRGRTLAQQARALSAWRASVHDESAARGAVAAREGDTNEALQALQSALAPYRVDGETGDFASLKASVDTLRDETEAHHQAERRVEAQERTVGEAEDHNLSLKRRIEDFWARRAPVRGRDTLVTRLEDRVRWEKLTAEANALDGALAESARKLTDPSVARALGVDPLGLDVEAAMAVQARLQALADRHDDLADHVSRLEQRIETATRAHVVADAQAEVHASLRAASRTREELLRDSLARELLEQAGQEQARDRLPSRLERARDWLLRFTHGAYELGLDAKGRTFHARDRRDGTIKALGALSDGTRIQLLFAVRLAALEAGEEAGARVMFPLLLDETLATTDPERFGAVAESIFHLVDAGRQVVYLTSQPGEAAAWLQASDRLGRARPAVHHLGAAGQGEARWAVDVDVPLPTAAAIAAPMEGERGLAYAARVGVHPPDGNRACDAWDVGFLWPDDAEAVYACYSAQVRSVGQFRAQAQVGAMRRIVSSDAARTGRWRAAALEALLEGWRQGRHRPVTWADVEASGAVTPAFADRMRELLVDYGHDALAYWQAVTGLKSFRGKNSEQLRAHLEDHRLIATTSPLGVESLQARALAAALAVEEVPPGEVAAYVGVLVGLLG